MRILEGDVEWYVLGRLTEREAVVLSPSLAERQDCGSRRQTSTSAAQMTDLSGCQGLYSGEDRRRDGVRVQMNDGGSIVRLNPPCEGRSEVRVLDASKGGVKISVPEMFHVGTLIHLRTKHLLVIAEVRYCVGAGDNYHAGAQIQDVFPRTT